LVVVAHKGFKIIWLSNMLVLSVPDEGYSGNASCELNLISTFLLLGYFDNGHHYLDDATLMLK
jgi:hypothetical protein